MSDRIVGFWACLINANIWLAAVHPSHGVIFFQQVIWIGLMLIYLIVLKPKND